MKESGLGHERTAWSGYGDGSDISAFLRFCGAAESAGPPDAEVAAILGLPGWRECGVSRNNRNGLYPLCQRDGHRLAHYINRAPEPGSDKHLTWFIIAG